MADVNKAWQFVLGDEDTVPPTGKVTPEPNGGKARLGINSIAHPEAVARGFYSMPLDEALEYAFDVFKYDYWSRMLGYNIESQVMASKLASMVINQGPKEAITLLQRAINKVRGNEALKVDGCMGPGTLAVLNTYLDETDVNSLFAALVAQGCVFYEGLRDAHPERYSAEMEAEWIKRMQRRPSDT